MDMSGTETFFENGDIVRLLRDYLEIKKGMTGEFIQYVGNSELAVVQFGRMHASVWPNDLEKVPVRKVKG